MTFNVCIIGCGARGKGHAKTWAARDDARVVAVFDTDAQRAAELAAEHDATAHDSYRDAIAQEGVNVVSVCVPTHLHAEVTCFAAEQGRHVFCEKPLALTVEDGERMLEAVGSNGVVFSPCFQHRDRYLHVKQRELVRDGTCRGPVYFRFTDVREVRPKTAMHRASMNGGVVIDMGCHMFDMMRYITGAEPVSVSATGHVFGRGKQRLAGIDDLAIDEADIQVRMTGGHHMSMYLNWGMPEGFRAPINHQMLVAPNLAVHLAGGEVIVQYADHREAWPDAASGTHTRVARLVAAIRGEDELDVTGADALVALKMSHAALESIRTGETVTL
ncbi:MAG: Gfo/Idh/MocA family protein [Planctomycetota bacterium]